MSRPWARPKPAPPVLETIKLLQNATMNDLWDAHAEANDYRFEGIH
jgi:hypothetical protein